MMSRTVVSGLKARRSGCVVGLGVRDDGYGGVHGYREWWIDIKVWLEWSGGSIERYGSDSGKSMILDMAMNRLGKTIMGVKIGSDEGCDNESLVKRVGDDRWEGGLVI
ncbi:unnamed protein product [Dovyalis caffra]|uniref:Uncharacterized protein n=1 Tax=Dovyalis caffra TaxID=77055 RepID=A0AAV1R5K3_9ROSI|nr:unnamed protein product [Dovyalis caffra]